MRALLDVNVLLALLDLDHIQHQQARRWFENEIRHGWASCAITQNGFMRVRSQPGYPGAVSPREAARRLADAVETEHHEYWRCELSLLDATAVDHARIHGPRQITDVYLLALAVRNGGRFVTFDRTISPRAVRNASDEHLVVP